MGLSLEQVQEIVGLLQARASDQARDRRRDERFPLVGSVTIVPRSTLQPIGVVVRDFSASGVGLLHTEKIPRGEEFVLFLPQTGKATVQAVLCAVAYCAPITSAMFGIGASFTRIIGGERAAQHLTSEDCAALFAEASPPQP